MGCTSPVFPQPNWLVGAKHDSTGHQRVASSFSGRLMWPSSYSNPTSNRESVPVRSAWQPPATGGRPHGHAVPEGAGRAPKAPGPAGGGAVRAGRKRTKAPTSPTWQRMVGPVVFCVGPHRLTSGSNLQECPEHREQDPEKEQPRPTLVGETASSELGELGPKVLLQAVEPVSDLLPVCLRLQRGPRCGKRTVGSFPNSWTRMKPT